MNEDNSGHKYFIIVPSGEIKILKEALSLMQFCYKVTKLLYIEVILTQLIFDLCHFGYNRILAQRIA